MSSNSDNQIKSEPEYEKLKQFHDKIKEGFKIISDLTKEPIESIEDVIEMIKRLKNKVENKNSEDKKIDEMVKLLHQMNPKLDKNLEINVEISENVEKIRNRDICMPVPTKRKESVPKPVGLTNMFFCCYLNASLQLLSASSTLVEQFKMKLETHSQSNQLSLLYEILDQLKTGMKVKKHPSNGQLFQKWNKLGMQDSFELISYVINQVNRDLIQDMNVDNWTKHEIPLVLKIRYTSRCAANNHVYKSPSQIDIAIHLNLPNETKPKNKSIELKSLVNNLTKDEKIVNYICDNKACGEFCDGFKYMKLREIPKVLLLHIQRNKLLNSTLIKNDIKIDFEKELILKNELFELIDNDSVDDDQVYELVGFIQHYGTINRGHYKCFKIFNDKWYEINDLKVTSLDWSTIKKKNPYIMIYDWKYAKKYSECNENKSNNSSNGYINSQSSVDTETSKVPSSNNSSNGYINSQSSVDTETSKVPSSNNSSNGYINSQSSVDTETSQVSSSNSQEILELEVTLTEPMFNDLKEQSSRNSDDTDDDDDDEVNPITENNDDVPTRTIIKDYRIIKKISRESNFNVKLYKEYMKSLFEILNHCPSFQVKLEDIMKINNNIPRIEVFLKLLTNVNYEDNLKLYQLDNDKHQCTADIFLNIMKLFLNEWYYQITNTVSDQYPCPFLIYTDDLEPVYILDITSTQNDEASSSSSTTQLFELIKKINDNFQNSKFKIKLKTPNEICIKINMRMDIEINQSIKWCGNEYGLYRGLCMNGNDTLELFKFDTDSESQKMCLKKSNLNDDLKPDLLIYCKGL